MYCSLDCFLGVNGNLKIHTDVSAYIDIHRSLVCPQLLYYHKQLVLKKEVPKQKLNTLKDLTSCKIFCASS